MPNSDSTSDLPPAPSSGATGETNVAAPRRSASEEERFDWPISLMTRETFRKGEYLFKMGEKAEKLYYVSKGIIRLPEINLFMQAGQIIGEMGIFSPEKNRTASAVAEEDVEAYTLTSDEVKALISREPALGININ